MSVPDWKWQEAGACHGRDEDQTLFFGPEGEQRPQRIIREAKATAICDGCPVRALCRETAFILKMDTGVWGGLGEDERRSKRRTWVKNNSLHRRIAATERKQPAEKHCPSCMTTKPAADFPKDRYKSDGLFRVCKPCANREHREARARQAEAPEAVAS